MFCALPTNRVVARTIYIYEKILFMKNVAGLPGTWLSFVATFRAGL
jgi:hypothetical protein